MPEKEIQRTSASEVRDALLSKREVALLDVREEAPHATGHPLFAANMPAGRIELEAYTRLPRKEALIVVFDNGEGLADKSAAKLTRMGYANVSLLDGNLQGWKDAGYEIFIDVNAPSKAFGELVEEECGTPSLSAQQVQQIIEEGDDYIIVDARRYDEFQTMSIPTAVSVPGAELVLRIKSLAPKAETRVIVNCAGRTRSIIGTQSLINVGIPNPVAALRNGAIGWRLAQQDLAQNAFQSFPKTTESDRLEALERAIKVAMRAGVQDATSEDVETWRKEETRTTYFFDVRTPAEFLEGHLPDFRNAPGGQLVQETDMFAPVIGARIVLCDTDGVRARMTGSWLRQMGWEAWALSRVEWKALTENGPSHIPLPEFPDVPVGVTIRVDSLQDLKQPCVVLDFSTAAVYRAGHVADSHFASRDHLDEVVQNLTNASSFVVTASNADLARIACDDLRNATDKDVFLLDRSSVPPNDFTIDRPQYACEVQDRYMRPYEGTAAGERAMQAYLDWEAGLVAQLKRDGTHHFFTI